MTSSHKFRPLILPLFLLPFTAAQSSATGDLSKSAPYDIPPDKFKSATSNPTAVANFAISGYNISVPAGEDSGNGSAVNGWHLGIGVAADVSLSDSGDDDVDKSKVTEATTLSLTTPGTMVFDRSWRMCAFVYPGLGADETASAQDPTNVDGTCTKLLRSDCIKQLVVAAQSTGIKADGSCEAVGVPEKCQGHFGEGDDTAFALNSDVIAANRFFAFGSTPTSSGNSTALGQAEANVWPVILSWVHLSSTGQIHAANANLACVKAGNGTGTGTGPGSGTGTSSPTPTPSAGVINTRAPNSWWALLFVGIVALLVL